MVRKAIIDDTLYTLELVQVQQLVERSLEIDDSIALDNLNQSPELRHNVQAILDVMYRRPHGKRRITADTIAVTKLLLGFAKDIGNEIVEGAKEQFYANTTSDSDSDTGIIRRESTPRGENSFHEAYGEEATNADTTSDEAVLAESQGHRL